MADPLCWLDIVEPEHADGLLAEISDEIRRPAGSVHRLCKAVSVHPKPVCRSDGHCRAVLCYRGNVLPEGCLQPVAPLASCDNAQTYHGTSLRHPVGDVARAEATAAGRETDALGPAP